MFDLSKLVQNLQIVYIKNVFVFKTCFLTRYFQIEKNLKLKV